MTVTEEKLTRSDELDRSRMTVEAGLNVFVPNSDLLGEVECLYRKKYLPEQIIDRYLDESVKRAEVKKLEDGNFFAEIPGFAGVWASDEDLARCGAELRDVLFDWLVLKIEKDDRDIPVIAGINLNVL